MDIARDDNNSTACIRHKIDEWHLFYAFLLRREGMLDAFEGRRSGRDALKRVEETDGGKQRRMSLLKTIIIREEKRSTCPASQIWGEHRLCNLRPAFSGLTRLNFTEAIFCLDSRTQNASPYNRRPSSAHAETPD